MHFEEVRVPAENLLLGEGRGFEIAQAGLGRGASTTACASSGRRSGPWSLPANARSGAAPWAQAGGASVRAGKPCSLFSELESVRLLTLKTAATMDAVGAKDARDLDRGYENFRAPGDANDHRSVHANSRGGGLTADYPMAEAFNYARWCRQADGPDEVHMMALGRQLVKRYGA